MLVGILIKKILSLFIIMFLGAALVRLKILKREDSRVLSMVSIYLICPCMIINAFQVEFTDDVRIGLIFTTAASFAIILHMIFFGELVKKPLRLNPVEKCSSMYSNAANLIIPLITAILGEEWIIYTMPFTSVQMIALWSHAKSSICGETGIDMKKIVTNINLISIFVGLVLMFAGIRLYGPVADSVSTIGGMVGPVAMLINGMLIGDMDFRHMKGGMRMLLPVALRLVVFPLPVLLVMKYSGVTALIPDGKELGLILLMASVSPVASTITQLAQVYVDTEQAEYASTICIVTTLLCILTMPLFVFLYQL